MLTREALEIVLDMAKQYRYNLGGGSANFTDLEKEAIEEVGVLLKGFDDDFRSKYDTTSENGGC